MLGGKLAGRAPEVELVTEAATVASAATAAVCEHTRVVCEYGIAWRGGVECAARRVGELEYAYGL
jgi:hypothetical protein